MTRRKGSLNKIKKTKKCIDCGVDLTESNCFLSSRRNYSWRCINCQRKRGRIWAGLNRARFNIYRRKWAQQLKFEVLSHYSRGKPRCERCGFDDIKALSMDHIEGGGKKHFKEIGGAGPVFYNWLRLNDYPSKFQVLCMNCQWIKREEEKELYKKIGIKN